MSRGEQNARCRARGVLKSQTPYCLLPFTFYPTFGITAVILPPDRYLAYVSTTSNLYLRFDTRALRIARTAAACPGQPAVAAASPHVA
eukprot:6060626-Pleurochrysis_carterae.AAC.1